MRTFLRRFVRWCVSLVFAAVAAGCMLDWTPLLPPTCGLPGQPCCASATAGCRNGSVCTANMCSCANASQAVCNDVCVDLQTTSAHCGACDRACPSGQSCVSGACMAPCTPPMVACGSTCTDVQTDAMNCGMCGHACTTGQACSNGMCVIECTAGQSRCGSTCVDLQTSATNCGSCNTSCATVLPHANATCSGGTCRFGSCEAGFADCDASQANGCETDTRISAMHCGMCGFACPAATNATPSCAASSCGYTCNTGFSDCNAMTTDGCETPTSADPMHCGTCTTVCPTAANATPTCASSVCGIQCDAGFGNCDGSAANGCEIATATDRNNCGTCDNRCRGAQNCVAGVCQ